MFETRIYIASTEELQDKSLFDRLYKTVPEYRQKKIDSYTELKDKCLCLGSGLLLSRALKDAGFDESTLEYAYKSSGMPYFINESTINFSLSHSEERVMCGISIDPIGVDVEFVRDNQDKDFEKWVMTESYAKATDTSLILLLNGTTAFNTEFRFKYPDLKDGYKYAVCSEEFINDNQIEKVTFV
ncbi:MAG: hypothetical protein K5839_05900 [Treponemataceae bacterium]|nr:hypothetical protein [Treponemataceae bacterium]